MCVLCMSNYCKIIIHIIIYTPHNKIVYSTYSSSSLINFIFALALVAAVLLGRCTSLCSFTFGKLSFKLFSLKLLFTFGKTYVLSLVISKGTLMRLILVGIKFGQWPKWNIWRGFNLANKKNC